MESNFGPVLFNPVNIEPSTIIEKWHRLNIISDVKFTTNSLHLSGVYCPLLM